MEKEIKLFDRILHRNENETDEQFKVCLQEFYKLNDAMEYATIEINVS